MRSKRHLITAFPGSGAFERLGCDGGVCMNETSYAALEARLKSDLPEQIEVRVRRERRRRWPLSEKLRILREAFAPGAIAKQVAERYEISTGLLFTWRRQALASAAPGFMPVQIAAISARASRPRRIQHRARPA